MFLLCNYRETFVFQRAARSLTKIVHGPVGLKVDTAVEQFLRSREFLLEIFDLLLVFYCEQLTYTNR